MSRTIGRSLMVAAMVTVATAAVAQSDSGRGTGDRWRDCDGCPEVVSILPGSFMMGSPETEEHRYEREGPLHPVTIARPFAIGVYEVTRDEYSRFVRATNHSPQEQSCMVNEGVKWKKLVGVDWRNLAFPQTVRHPVVCVSWNDAAAYVEWLSEYTGVRYRLPSAAEWEYAARAGSTAPWYWGNNTEPQCRHANGADQASGFPWALGCNDGYAKTSLVGSYQPNAFELYDMLGNAWEWVQDCYTDSYVGAPADGSAWEEDGCAGRVMRGASWASTPKYLRAAHRGGEWPSFRSDYTGFRVARDL